MNETIRGAVAKFGTDDLRHVNARLEAELMAAVEAGRTGQAVLGALEMLQATGAELLARAALVHPFAD